MMKRCTYCGSADHPTSHCPKTHGGSAKSMHLRCTYCGGRDHNYEACVKHAGGGKLPGAVRVVKRGMLGLAVIALALLGLVGGARAQCVPTTPGVNPIVNCVTAQNLQSTDYVLVYQNAFGQTRKATAAMLLSSQVLDQVFGGASGDILCHNASAWIALPPGTANQLLQTHGVGSCPSWVGLSAAIDAAIGATRGSMLERGASGWQIVAPGTAGYVWTSGGAGADPAYVAPSVAATLTNDKVWIGNASNVPTEQTVSGDCTLSNAGVLLCTQAAGYFALPGTLTPPALSGDVNNYSPTGLATASALRINGGAGDRNITGLAGGADGRLIDVVNVGTTNNLVLKNQSGSSSGANQFLLPADVTLPINTALALRYDGTTGAWRPWSRALANSGVTAGSYGSAAAVPVITVDVAGRVTAASTAALAAVAASGSASDLTTGTLAAARLPNPTASTLGGIESYVAVTNQFLDSISTSGVPHSAQPAFTNLSGSATCGQLPALTGDVTSSAGSCATTVAEITSALVFAFPSTLAVTAQTLDLPIIWTSGHITGVEWATGGGGSFTVEVKYDGTDVTGCNAINVNSATDTITSCTSTAVVKQKKVSMIISSPSGTVNQAYIAVIVTHTVN